MYSSNTSFGINTNVFDLDNGYTVIIYDLPCGHCAAICIPTTAAKDQVLFEALVSSPAFKEDSDNSLIHGSDQEAIAFAGKAMARPAISDVKPSGRPGFH